MSYIAEMCRQSPSEILHIFDGLTAFQFNAAVVFARREHEAKLDENRAIILTNKIAQMLSGKPKPEEKEINEEDEW